MDSDLIKNDINTLYDELTKLKTTIELMSEYQLNQNYLIQDILDRFDNEDLVKTTRTRSFLSFPLDQQTQILQPIPLRPTSKYYSKKLNHTLAAIRKTL